MKNLHCIDKNTEVYYKIMDFSSSSNGIFAVVQDRDGNLLAKDIYALRVVTAAEYNKGVK